MLSLVYKEYLKSSQKHLLKVVELVDQKPDDTLLTLWVVPTHWSTDTAHLSTAYQKKKTSVFTLVFSLI